MTILDIQLKQIETWAKLLTIWGVKFKIVLPDETEYGDLEVVKEKKRKPRKFGPTPYGAIQAYFGPLVSSMGVGEVVSIPCNEFEAERLRGGISAWVSKNWGNGNGNTHINKEKNTVEVMRIC